MKMHSTVIFAATAAILGTTSLASATVILSDNFDGRTNGNSDPLAGTLDSDWGSNNNTLGGSITQTYVTTPDRTSGGVQQTVQSGTGVLRFGATAINYDLHTNSTVTTNKSYVVNFDFQRAAASGFVAVFFGAEPSAVSAKDANAAFGPINQIPDYAPTVEAAFLFQNNSNVGRVQVFSFGTQQGGNIDNAYDDTTTGTIGIHQAEVLVEAPNGFGAGNPITYTLKIDGITVPGAVVTAISDGGSGTVGFSSNQAGGKIDNLVITSVPEPATIGLLALSGLMIGRRRRA